ncbi:AAA family ATPase [uncultured Treponema sp.]|uniref:AAA family ATPase n=1 Tax=uncultured Treponema sp. TaxID=162155 RepID=UPI0025E82EF4|nr:AAA family ATPase [uncultured Treponema sp.]
MELDAEFRKTYKKIIVALLTINNFTVDYYETNENLRKIILEFLDDSFFERFTKKQDLLKAVTSKNLDNSSDEEILGKAHYLNAKTINYLFYKQTSLFSSLTIEEKKCLLILDFCNHSLLSNIFFSNEIAFPLHDFYKVVEFVLDIKPKKFKAAMTEASKLELVDFNESDEVLNIKDINYNETVLSRELYRLSEIPLIERFNLEDYEVSGNNSEKLFSEQNLVTVTGECITSYIFSKFENEKIRFWYASTINKCIGLLRLFNHCDIKGQYIWLDNYEEENAYREKKILQIANHIEAKLIVSGHDLFYPFAKDCMKISLKNSCLERKVRKLFPEELAQKVLFYMKKIDSTDEIRNFISEIDSLAKDTSQEFAMKSLPDYFNIVDKSLKEDSSKAEEKKEPIQTAIREEDFKRRYDIYEGSVEDNPVLSTEYSKIIRIYKKLMAPAAYLKADKQMFQGLDALINKHPNLLDKDLLSAFLKNAILFSKDSIISLEPLLLVGHPGCGKSLFCRQLRELFKQDNDIFIPLGSGLGADAIMGSTPDYKAAENGKVLSSVWESMNNINCLNPLVVLDEVDKACLTSKTSDHNQNLLPSLLQLMGDENRRHFTDNFFDVPLQGFYPNFIATANSLEYIPEPLLDRFNVIEFRDYTKEEFVNNVIPAQYEVFKDSHNNLIPENLTQDEIEIIYKISKGKTRKIQPAINRYVASIFDFEGQKHQLNATELDNLVETSKVVWEPRQIGFCK